MKGRLSSRGQTWINYIRVRVSLEDIWQREVLQSCVAYGLLEITCQQQLLTECALLLAHILASGRTGHNSVSEKKCLL